jgi:peptide/nickel transport system substrate-binding protein
MFTSRVRASICLTAVLAAFAVACSSDARRVALHRSDAEIDIGTFLPKIGKASPSMSLAALFSAEPLVAVEWDGRPTNRLTESVVESEDGETLTVTLKPDVTFHSGEPVTAGRVRELILPKVKLLAEQDVANVVADDGSRRITFHLRRPYALKPADLSSFVIDDDTRLGLRTGPFRITSAGPSVVMEPYRNYHLGAPPAVKKITINEYPTHRAAWSAMLRGQVNFLHEVNRDAIEFVRTGGRMTPYPLLRPFYSALVFNLRHPVLRRREVRVALNEGIDRNEVLNNGMAGHGEVAEGPFWPRHWAYPRGRLPVSHNPEAARVRLDAAGLKVRRGSANEMPSRLSFTCLLPLGDVRFERIALVVQRQLFAIGVDMRLQPVPPLDLYRRAKAGDFDAVITEMSSGRTLKFPGDFFHSRGPFAYWGYTGADAAFDHMRTARTDDDVRSAVLDVMRQLQTDPPAVFLALPREVRAADNALDIPYETDQDVFYTLWRARPRATQSARR